MIALAPSVDPAAHLGNSGPEIDDAIEANRVFTMLVGDSVEPLRDFIESNALRAAKLGWRVV